jgi:hypothetical protein
MRDSATVASPLVVTSPVATLPPCEQERNCGLAQLVLLHAPYT